MSSTFVLAALASVALVLTESVLRVNAPSFARPSTLMNSATTFIAEWAYWLGYHAARITDLYYFIKKYLGDDVVVLVTASWRLATAPLEAVHGYVVYYMRVAETNWYLSVTLCLALVAIVAYMYPAPLYWLCEHVTPVRYAMLTGATTCMTTFAFIKYVVFGVDHANVNDNDTASSEQKPIRTRARS